MELHSRVELIDTLFEEAEHKMHALHHALAAQERAQQEVQHAGDGTTPTEEKQTVKYEHALWEKAHAGLTELRTVLEEIEESERQRGLSQ